MAKAKVKSERSAALAAVVGTHASVPDGQSAASSRAHTPTGGPPTPGDDDALGAVPPSETLDNLPTLPHTGLWTKDIPADRTELLRQHPAETTKFINLIVPLLIDVYAASVSVPVRTKSLASLLKATAFQNEEQLRTTLHVGLSRHRLHAFYLIIYLRMSR